MSPVVTITSAVGISPKGELKADELEQYSQLKNHARDDFLAGRSALKQALKNYFGEGRVLDAKKVGIKNFENGQPYIENHNHLHCSLGHSRGWGIGAVAPYRIGVDIEKVRPHKKSLIDYIAEPEELNYVKNFSSANTDETTIVWTIKESVMKGLGIGFGISIKQIKIIGRENEDALEVVAVFSGESSLWQVWPFRFGDFYFTVAYGKNHQQKPQINWFGETDISFARS